MKLSAAMVVLKIISLHFTLNIYFLCICFNHAFKIYSFYLPVDKI